MSRRGYATVIVIVSIGLLAVILTAVMGRASDELRRVRLEAADAQASQLLAAAARVAQQQVWDSQKVSGPISVPIGDVVLTWSDDTCLMDVRVEDTRRTAEAVFRDGQLRRIN